MNRSPHPRTALAIPGCSAFPIYPQKSEHTSPRGRPTSNRSSPQSAICKSLCHNHLPRLRRLARTPDCDPRPMLPPLRPPASNPNSAEQVLATDEVWPVPPTRQLHCASSPPETPSGWSPSFRDKTSYASVALNRKNGAEAFARGRAAASLGLEVRAAATLCIHRYLSAKSRPNVCILGVETIRSSRCFSCEIFVRSACIAARLVASSKSRSEVERNEFETLATR